jgi:hypothetical protein
MPENTVDLVLKNEYGITVSCKMISQVSQTCLLYLSKVPSHRMLPQMDVSAGGVRASTAPCSWCSINVQVCPQGVSLDIAQAWVATRWVLPHRSVFDLDFK